MITDQLNTGVPSRDAFSMQGGAKRTQLVKPSQVQNTGLTANQAGSQSLQSKIQDNQSRIYNPVIPRPQQQVQAQPAQPQQTVASASQNVGAVNATSAPSSSSILNSMQTRAQAPAQNNSPVQQATQAPQAPQATSYNAINPANTTPVVNNATSALDDARGAIKKMSDKDIITLLNEISNGTLKGNY